MKTMSCKQMGGPCDHAMHGNTADEVIKEGEKHLKEMMVNGDQSHKAAMNMMNEMRKNPSSGIEWYTKTKDSFAALPED